MTLLSSDAIERVRAVMREFDETLRVPVELAYFEGLSQSEIAERLNQPLGTVKTRLRNAVAKLREALNQREEP
jgi:RNA polymerase sigma-70 factor (ECF subfamily)